MASEPDEGGRGAVLRVGVRLRGMGLRDALEMDGAGVAEARRRGEAAPDRPGAVTAPRRRVARARLGASGRSLALRTSAGAARRAHDAVRAICALRSVGVGVGGSVCRGMAVRVGALRRAIVSPAPGRWGGLRLIASALLCAGLALAGGGWRDAAASDLGPRIRPGQVFEAQAAATDGDSLRLEGVSAAIRIFGIDAPERGQSCRDAAGRGWSCGAAATARMRALAARGPMRCVATGDVSYGRIVAACTAAGGEDAAEILVRDGLALAETRYSERYVPAQIEALKAGRGLWSGAFTPPWEWRRGVRLGDSGAAAPAAAGGASAKILPDPAAPRAASAEGCTIKGNISSKGVRIYHAPGQEHYARTRIDLAKGERWFCNEAEARAAGWRRARR